MPDVEQIKRTKAAIDAAGQMLAAKQLDLSEVEDVLRENCSP